MMKSEHHKLQFQIKEELKDVRLRWFSTVYTFDKKQVGCKGCVE